MKKDNILQAVKFALFSASAGLIQIGSFTLLNELAALPYWPAYLISLILSIVWNFTFNRRFTFKSAANIPVAMTKVFGFYVVFTPLSTWLGDLATSKWTGEYTEYVVLAVTMLSNFILEYLFCKFVVYRGQENNREDKKDEKTDER